MADNLTLNAGSGGATLATDDITSVHYQRVKLVDGTLDSTTAIAAGGGVEAGALRVTIATDSTGVVSVDDNGGSLTVDGTVAVSGTVTVGSHAVTNAGTFATQVDGAALTALQVIDNPVVVDDAAFTPATTSVMMAGFEFDDTTPDSVNEGDAGAARMSANRNQYVQIRDAAGNERGLNVAADGSIAITVATVPSHAVTNAGTFATQATLQTGSNAIGKLAANSGVDIGDVDVLTLPNVTLAAGTNTNEVVGDAAHDAAIAGNPVRVAGRAVTADYTSVATGDTADLITTLGGKLITHPYAIPENYIKGATSDMTATTSTSVIAAAAAGIKNYITHILVQNSHATVGTWVNIQDGSGGATLYTVYAAPLGGGASITLPCPIPTTAATALYCANVTTGANTRVSASGYKAP